MIYSRRDFLEIASKLLATSATVPALLRQTAWAAAAQEPTSDRILVVLQLTGGNDGLNTVVPFTDENYRRLRPKLHLADTKLHKLDERIGLHESLKGLAALFENEQACVVQSVGYPNPNRSHFESMAIWQTAPSDAQLRSSKAAALATGWLARAIDLQAKPDVHAGACGLHVGSGEMPQALLGCRVPVPSLSDLDQLKRRGELLTPSLIEAQLAGWRQTPRDATTNPLLAAARASGVAVQATAEQIDKIQITQSADVKYPDGKLADQLRLIAELIRAGFAAPFYYTELGGFDTHSRQANTHSYLLESLGAALRAFVEDVTAHVPSRPVLVLVFSEFGRRVEENASEGTDHGTAAPVFLAGHGLVPGVHGSYPDLGTLVDGDPVFAVDFRQIYATVLEDWLGLASEPILGQKFKKLAVLKPWGV